MRTVSNSCFALFAFLLIIALNSCKEKGCTDPTAINYNSIADKDDGSCIHCKTEETIVTTVSLDVVDNNFSSSHYNQTVARIILTQISDLPNDLHCGPQVCRVQGKIQNLLNNQGMAFNYEIFCSSGISFNYTSQANLNASQSASFEIPSSQVQNTCFAMQNPSLFLQSNIVYH